jgi:hypothetical protein
MEKIKNGIEDLAKGSLTQDLPLQVFFMNQFPPALSVPLGPFRIFTKIRVDIRNFVFSPVLLTLVIKPCPGFSSIP